MPIGEPDTHENTSTDNLEGIEFMDQPSRSCSQENLNNRPNIEATNEEEIEIIFPDCQANHL